MSRSTNPISMVGWFGFRHIPYAPESKEFGIARDIAIAKLPKKEFFEAIHFADRVRSFIDPQYPVFDCCSGHGLLAMLLASETRLTRVVGIDQKLPPNCQRLFDVFSKVIPQFAERVQFVQGSVQKYQGFGQGAFVASHACGNATDLIINAAIRNHARFFVMTCCITRQIALRYGFPRAHDFEHQINRQRLERVAAAGYETTLLTIDRRITPWNTILTGWPIREEAHPRGGLRPTVLPARLPPRLEQEMKEALGEGRHDEQNSHESEQDSQQDGSDTLQGDSC